MHCTGSGYEKTLTPFTITDPEKLMSTIESAKQLGYALSSEELEMGMRSLAVPVMDSREDCVGAMSVSAFSGRYSPGELVEAALPILKDAAEELGKTL
ncbi:IclR family transcriptional regulator domain-containing protein [Enteractinococcus helveticum]|nr:IclR family transcriptional regulator C-terminal domain-containing protein [Enteractinococcus helveticum]